MIKAVIFDFGGVMAEEGFRNGLYAIAEKNGIAPASFFSIAENLIYQTGYVIGMSDESFYLNTLREKTGISQANSEIKEEILKGFTLRPVMMEHVRRMRDFCIITAILSDQTNWLDEIDQKTPFYNLFDLIFNSFKINKGKRDPSVFRDVCLSIGLKPEDTLFVDDNIKNIQRASDRGLKVIHYKDTDDFKKELERFVPYLYS